MNPNADDERLKDHRDTVKIAEETGLKLKEADPLLGKTLDGRFLIESIIGIGGMATAYKAQQIELDRTVVIKVLKGETDEEGLRRFQREALILSKLDAPGIVKVFTFGISDGLPYMVMDYVEGESLAEMLKRNGPLSHEQVIQISIQLCDALEKAHELGILHRDIKPSNIIVHATEPADGATEYKAQLLDFGIAKITGSKTATLTNVGDIFGSPPYMSPEQCCGKEVDARSDIYSLACTIFEMTTAKTVFEGNSPAEILLKHCNEAVPRFCQRNAQAESTIELEEIVMKCLSKEADQRYASMKELKEELVRLSQNTSTHALPSRETKKISPPKRRALVAVASFLCISIALSLSFLLLANEELWESILQEEEQAGLTFLLPPTENLAENSITRSDRSTEACKKLMKRLDRLKEKHGQIYRVALPPTLHFVASHATQFDFMDLKKLNDEACSYCLDKAKLKQEFALANVPADLHRLSKNASGLPNDRTISRTEEAFAFLWRPFYVFCQFKMKKNADKKFNELAIKQFDLVLPQVRNLLKILAGTDAQMAKSHVQLLFSHLTECQSIMGEAQARTMAQNIMTELPLSHIVNQFKANYSFSAEDATPRPLIADECKAYFPIALYLYNKARQDGALRDVLLTQAFFKNLVIGAVEQTEAPAELQKLSTMLLQDNSDKWINAVHVNLTDAKPKQYREFWAKQAKRLLNDNDVKLQARQQALLNLGLGFECLEHGDIEKARIFYDQAEKILKEHPRISNRRTRVVFRMLVMKAYFAYQDNDKATAVACINEFIPQMPRTIEPYLIRALQEQLRVQLEADGERALVHRLDRRLKMESEFSPNGELNSITEQLSKDENY